MYVTRSQGVATITCGAAGRNQVGWHAGGASLTNRHTVENNIKHHSPNNVLLDLLRTLHEQQQQQARYPVRHAHPAPPRRQSYCASAKDARL